MVSNAITLIDKSIDLFLDILLLISDDSTFFACFCIFVFTALVTIILRLVKP